jgi:hypothetical protein
MNRSLTFLLLFSTIIINAQNKMLRLDIPDTNYIYSGENFSGRMINANKKDNAYPEASNLTITGSFNPDSTLVAVYDYNDNDGDLQGLSDTAWYRYSDSLGTGKTLIAETDSLLVGDSLSGYWIGYDLIPKALTGGRTGLPAYSYWDSCYYNYVAYYPFNGNANDESGNGNDGTVYGATLTTDRFGNSNSAYSFDGVNDYVSVPTSTVDILNNFTVSAWVYKSLKSLTDDNDRIFSFVNNANNGFQLIFDEVTDKYGVVLKRGGTNIINQKTYGAWVTDEWVLITYVVNGTTGTFYKNGEVVATDGSTTIAIGSTNAYLIGARSDLHAVTFFNGSIDDIKIYDRALSETEILQIYNP